MTVNIISRKLIKPSTPTPQNLKKYKISFTDEISLPSNMNIILFYPPNPNSNPITIHLEESLAKILPQFYPFAGRYIKKDHLVDCNDEGAEFVEAEANDIELMDFIAKTENHQLNDLVSLKLLDADKHLDPLLSVQITHFKCGGLSICVSMSHRISDASTLGTFIAAWSNANNTNTNNNTEPIITNFDSPSLFPGINLEYSFQPPNPPLIIKRLSFNKEAISSLRSKLSPNKFISRVRLVTALISKALIGVEIAKYGKSRACFIGQIVNMRGKTIPPLPKHSYGNLIIQSITQCMAANETKQIGLQELVNIIGDAIDKTVYDCAELLSVGQDQRMKIILDPLVSLMEMLQNGRINNNIMFSDMSKVGLYENDFGWGTPVWVGVELMHGENFTLLMGNKEGDGIEAWVHLDPNDVPYFEQDEVMKMFATTWPKNSSDSPSFPLQIKSTL
ncbi:pelargonidin 3-o-(6-caffeoylglucoside) 5-o-(6-o-malonylglucoside) 4'''-malonyltransferase [Phtheirospermum japonicum]|uniref:Pelargonidin 3-o-(6-caffeoylglucoside) 5-o-(6-o-malonylglucoside) 4'''-malonyltransferase n=1 Tax=Phtheirospermum japonicum TaxID=374723 RepID=A0A830BJG3_9LAMI|nr:pelargonidin 3-o-(6-caffeoylglucoside) 5-o-(6-o-malonylglucoside) 4'''-malonyltransferase [Phtheirospermum japonicum]